MPEAGRVGAPGSMSDLSTDGGTMRTWGGRFSGETDARVADFTRSIEVDAALAADDIAGSIAHVRGLGRAGHPERGRGRRRSSTA